MENFTEIKTITFKHLLLCNVENPCVYNIKQAINTPLDAVEVLNTIYKMSHLPEEIFAAIFLDYKYGINGIAKISHGTAIMAPVSTRDLYKNGQQIPLPPGYTQDECTWFVSPRYHAGFGGIRQLYCWADGNRVVTSWNYGEKDRADYTGPSNYIIIGVKQ